MKTNILVTGLVLATVGTVLLYPTKNGTPVGRMHRITFSDGTQLFDMDTTEPPSKRVEYKE